MQVARHCSHATRLGYATTMRRAGLSDLEVGEGHHVSTTHNAGSLGERVASYGKGLLSSYHHPARLSQHRNLDLR